MATFDVLNDAGAMEALKGLREADLARAMGFVTAVSKRLDDLCGPIVKRQVGPVVMVGGSSTIFLDAKVSGTVTVTEAWSSETPVAVGASRFVADDDGIGTRLTKWSDLWAPRVTLTYTAGRFETTADVEEPFTTAAGLLLQAWWRPSNGGGSETYGAVLASLGLDSDTEVLKMLSAELLPPVAL